MSCDMVSSSVALRRGQTMWSRIGRARSARAAILGLVSALSWVW
jgi:hypothetical protein